MLCADDIYKISVTLMNVICEKIKSIQKHHITVLVVIFNYFLYLVSMICEHRGNEENIEQYMEKLKEQLTSWLSHHNVIGGSSFGGSNKQLKVKEELQVCYM